MKIREVVDALEKFAPLPLQEEYDNSGLQVGLTETEVSGALLCIDVTETTVNEAIARGCNLIISHHPLLFHPLKSLSDKSETERCVYRAVQNGITVYSAHTNLDNARYGVNYKIASVLGLRQIEWLDSHGDDCGSGIVGLLDKPLPEEAFLDKLKDLFSVNQLRCNGRYGNPVLKVAVCGGAGAFLIPKAVACGADVFVTGEIGYHRFFGYDGQILLVEMGHYESEKFTVSLIESVLRKEFPDIRVTVAESSNLIRYY